MRSITGVILDDEDASRPIVGRAHAQVGLAKCRGSVSAASADICGVRVAGGQTARAHDALTLVPTRTVPREVAHGETAVTVPVALRVGEIGFLPRNLSDRLFIFYPTLGYEPPLAPEIGGINAGPTISRPKLIREIVLFGDVMQSLLACRSSLIDWKGWV